MISPGRLGIAITTFNRCETLCNLLKTIKELTIQDYTVVVCDDGSTDDSVRKARDLGAIVVTGENRGIAWNKNRGIYYLVNYSDVSTIVLLDDDVVPEIYGWDQEWIQATHLYGHVNHAIVSTDEFTRGPNGRSASRPSLNTLLSGVCLSFSRAVLAEIGYMDTRFGKYGHEHTDFTLRAMKRGYGGFFGEQNFFLTIRGGLKALDLPSHGSEESSAQNLSIRDQIFDEDPFRQAWRDLDQYETLMTEMKNVGVGAARLYLQSAQKYLDDNPDIKAELTGAAVHWLSFGRLEGRSWG